MVWGPENRQYSDGSNLITWAFNIQELYLTQSSGVYKAGGEIRDSWRIWGTWLSVTGVEGRARWT